MQLRRPVKVVLVVLALMAGSSLALSLWLSESDSGKRWVADRLEQAVSKSIPGSLRIGRLVELGPPLVVQDVRFMHPDGRVVLHAKEAEIVPDLSRAVRGQLGFERAAVNGGHIVLSPDPDGRVAFEAAVDAPSKPGEPSDPMGGLFYALQSMHVEAFEVHLKLADPADFKLRDVEGFVGVTRVGTPGTRIQLDRIRGRLADKLLGQRVELAEVNGWIHGKAEQVVNLDAAIRIDDGSLHAKIEYFDRDKVPVVIRISRATGEGDFVSGLLDFADGVFGDSLEVKTEDED